MLLSADRNGRTRIDSAIPLLFALEGAWSIARAARDPQLVFACSTTTGCAILGFVAARSI
jgi:hypothetical protein